MAAPGACAGRGTGGRAGGAAAAVSPPLSPPLSPPVSPPVSPPLSPPLSPPVSPPLSPPVSPAVPPRPAAAGAAQGPPRPGPAPRPFSRAPVGPRRELWCAGSGRSRLSSAGTARGLPARAPRGWGSPRARGNRSHLRVSQRKGFPVVAVSKLAVPRSRQPCPGQPGSAQQRERTSPARTQQSPGRGDTGGNVGSSHAAVPATGPSGQECSCFVQLLLLDPPLSYCSGCLETQLWLRDAPAGFQLWLRDAPVDSSSGSEMLQWIPALAPRCSSGFQLWLIKCCFLLQAS
ncbi:proline-rich protein 36-like [Myiozetetes cayanensis]|uniref:proline-rich protein 36-like n=1 Tax=Myiozetetes cayanensis TaxID=478635 RepID=UPI0021605BE9|nr:proline-rich protein 36-like [Myiozetetes cayanensis]